MLKRVAVIGSGSWGTVAAMCIAQNVIKMKDFDPKVRVWVHEEDINGRPLSEIINKDRVNVKYLPGYQLPSNIEAIIDIKEAVKDASHLVFVVPHQFVEKIASNIVDCVGKNTIGISLIKGIIEDGHNLIFISDMLKEKLGCHMSVLSGANIAAEIAAQNFSETTIGSDDNRIGMEWKKLIEADYFRVNVVNTCHPLELIGAMKNCIALSAGFVDGLGQGNNTKAAIMRIGMNELIEFCKLYTKVDDYSIFFESFGIADLITTCSGGRNRLVSKSYIETDKSLDQLEVELLNGQKLQGPDTLLHAVHLIKDKKLEHKFPLLMSTYCVIFENSPRKSFLNLLMAKMSS